MVLADTILLVEDDNALRLMLRGILEIQGYQVLEADSRDSALDILKIPSPVGVVILDLGLPPSPHTPVEGLALIRMLCDELRSLKIIVLTGQDQESAAFEAIREGAFDFLAKPASTADILQAVRRAFLFYRKEQEMAAGGLTRLQLNARVSDGLKSVRDEVEEKLVRQVLQETGFNVNQSAARLGLKRESLYYFLKKFGIERRDD
ncbi:MAG: response regulator [Desulfocapsaceae bacterium]|nr:response regulator [Desulfocapsaceae bacterium]